MIYVPPGAGSSVSYGIESTTGTTSTTRSSWKDELSVDVNASGATPLITSATGVTFTYTWSGSSESTIDVVAKAKGETRFGGPGFDRVNHNYDQIELLLSPIVKATVYTDGKVVWTFDLSGAIPLIVRVGWLNGDLANEFPPAVRTTLEAHGVTASDYAQILSANPYSADPAGLGLPDPSRFELFSIYAYEPLNNQYTATLTNSYTSSNTVTAEHSYSVGVTTSVTVLQAALKVGNRMTFTNYTATKNSAGSTSTQTLVLSMPSPGYTGSPNLYVYVDKMYKTFVFASR